MTLNDVFTPPKIFKDFISKFYFKLITLLLRKSSNDTNGENVFISIDISLMIRTVSASAAR